MLLWALRSSCSPLNRMEVMSFMFLMIPSVYRKPMARSKSFPGVLMVTLRGVRFRFCCFPWAMMISRGSSMARVSNRCSGRCAVIFVMEI